MWRFANVYTKYTLENYIAVLLWYDWDCWYGDWVAISVGTWGFGMKVVEQHGWLLNH